MKRLLSLSLALAACAVAPIDPIEPPAPPPEYDRKDYKHWVDADKDCQDTRQEVLIAESTTPVEFEDERECRVAKGVWVDPYTDRTFTAPSSVDIDHVIPLRAAHDAGAHAWDTAKREAFANDLEDPRMLRAVHLGANRSKGSRGPDEWLPENPRFRCQYIDEYAAMMDRWELSFTNEQIAVLNYMIHICNEGGVPPLPQ